MHWWFRTGFFLLNDGEDFLFVDRIRPDFRWRKFMDNPATTSATVLITLYTQDDPTTPANRLRSTGLTMHVGLGPFDPRARGRYFSLKVEGDDLGLLPA